MHMTRGFGLAMLSLLFIGSVAIAGSFIFREEGNVPSDLKGIALSKPVPLDRQTFASTNSEAVFPIPSRTKWTFLVVGCALPRYLPIHSWESRGSRGSYDEVHGESRTSAVRFPFR